jgi:DNA invertase Pin-like site-specific DNA recombinase
MVDQNNEMQLTDLRSYAAGMGWATIEYQENETRRRAARQRSGYSRLADRSVRALHEGFRPD